MPSISLDEGLSLHCAVDDYLWPWEAPTPVLMMHGFARNAAFWNRWVPAIAESRRIYRPDLLGCGASDIPAPGYHFTPEKIAAEILAVFAAMSLKWVHWVGESSGGIIGLLLAAAHPERIASLVLCNTPTRTPTGSSAFTRWTRPPRRTRCAPMAWASGTDRRSATDWTWRAPKKICATGSCARWTGRRPRSRRRCTIA